MTTALHKDLIASERHAPVSFEYADATARNAATGFVAADVGKLARQLDDNSLWLLTAITPTWKDIAMAGAPPAHATTHQDGGGDEINVAGLSGLLADDQNPVNHAGDHEPGGTDAMAVDAVAGTGSLRTLGTGAQQACAGNDARLSDDRNDPDAIHDNVAAEISVVTEKTTPVGTDLILIEDSADSNNKKRVQITNLPAVAGDAEELIVDVRKGSPGTINIGEVVYLSGWDAGQNLPEVELADASVAGTMPAFGIARSSITNSTTGTVTVAGTLESVDTSAWSTGDPLFVSETAGELTNSKPTGTALVQKFAQVLRSNPIQGVIQVFGAGRSNDLPNIAEDNLWLGNSSSVPTVTNRSGIDDTAIHENVSAEISGVTEKTTPISADLLLIEDSAASNAKKRVQIGNLPFSAPVFGTEYDYAEKTTSASTTATSWTQFLRLTTASLPAGTYRIGYSIFYRGDGGSTDHQIRVQVDDATDLIDPGDQGYFEEETSDGDSTQRSSLSGFRHLVLTAATHDIDIDFSVRDSGDDMSVYHAQIEIWRVS